MGLLKVSPSPHVHSGDSISKNMYWVLIALIPASIIALYNFGIAALILSLVSVISCVAVEWAIQKYLLKVPSTIKDGSAALTGLLLAFNLPTNIPLWIVVIGAIVAIGIGKMSFGGLGQNLFNPALAGRVFLLISFPVQMTTWPVPGENLFTFLDATTGATPLSVIKEGLANGQHYRDLITEIPSLTDLLLGFKGGSAGELSAIALLIGFGILLWKKVITWHIPVAIFVTVIVFTELLFLFNVPTAGPLIHLFSGGLMLGSIFMATDYVTSPMNNRGMLVFGAGIGLLTIIIRVFGAYPEGISFAILIMNAFVPIIDRYVKPKRFGEVTK